MEDKETGEIMDKAIKLSTDEALSLLPDGDTIHCFVSSSFALFGADWKRANVIKYIEEADSLQIGGDNCRAMGHGLVAFIGDEAKFFEAKEEELVKLEEDKR